MATLSKSTDRSCEGCGAAAGEECNPHMGCREMAVEPQYGSSQIIKHGFTFGDAPDSGPVGLDMAVMAWGEAVLAGFHVHRYAVTDRDGEPYAVVSVTHDDTGDLLSAYEITGRVS